MLTMLPILVQFFIAEALGSNKSQILNKTDLIFDQQVPCDQNALHKMPRQLNEVESRDGSGKFGSMSWIFAHYHKTGHEISKAFAQSFLTNTAHRTFNDIQNSTCVASQITTRRDGSIIDEMNSKQNQHKNIIVVAITVFNFRGWKPFEN